MISTNGVRRNTGFWARVGPTIKSEHGGIGGHLVSFTDFSKSGILFLNLNSEIRSLHRIRDFEVYGFPEKIPFCFKYSSPPSLYHHCKACQYLQRSGSSLPLTAEGLGSRRRMDSPVSKSGSSSDPHDESGHKSLAPAPLSYASMIPPLVVLRIPEPSERASNGTPEEIAMYEAFFESGFRGDVPSLIADLCRFFRISPSQLNPPVWRILIAIQSLSNEEDLPLGVDEVLFAYHLAPINGGEGRFHLRPHNGLPIVEELPKSDRKGLAFGKKWQERFVFMTLQGSFYRWNFVEGTHPARAEGESNVTRARALQPERRQVALLISSEVLRRSRLWDGTVGGDKEDPITAFKRHADALSAKRGIIGGIVSDDKVVITGSRRKMMVKAEATSSSHGRTLRDKTTTRSLPQSSGAEQTPDGLFSVLADLNSKVFPRDQTLLSSDDPPEVIQTIQGGLLRTISQLHHLEDRLLEKSPSLAREEVEKLTQQLSEEVSKRVAKEMELRDLQAKTKSIEGLVENFSAEALRLSREKQELEEAFAKLEGEIRSSEDRMTMAINGARITSQWEVMREWLNGQAHKWNLARELDHFKTVVLAKARLKGVDPLSFKDEPVIPPSSDMDVDPSA
ncbi:hypothetical protein Bca4012_037611 [Brassica carinata]